MDVTHRAQHSPQKKMRVPSKHTGFHEGWAPRQERRYASSISTAPPSPIIIAADLSWGEWRQPGAAAAAIAAAEGAGSEGESPLNDLASSGTRELVLPPRLPQASLLLLPPAPDDAELSGANRGLPAASVEAALPPGDAEPTPLLRSGPPPMVPVVEQL